MRNLATIDVALDEMLVNLAAIVLRLLTGAGTPRGFRTRVLASLAAVATPAGGLLVLLIVAAGDQTAAVTLSIEPDLSS